MLGCGASGLMLGAHLNKKALFIEHNSFGGAKVKASGGAKCNVTNERVSSKNYLGDESFTSFALKNFSNKDTLNFLENYGIYPNIRTLGQYFCNSSKDVLNALNKANRKHEFLFSTKIESISYKNEKFLLKSHDKTFTCKKLIVASGGVSFATLGATDIGYKIAEHFGHEIKAPTPALVGLTLQKEQFWMKELSGIAFLVEVKIKDFVYRENLLFSHKGISGPVVLNTSLRFDKGSFEVDFLPEFTFNEKMWNDKKQLTYVLPLPKRFIKAFLDSHNLIDKPLKNYTNEEKKKIISLKNYIMSPSGTFGLRRAEVTKGGVKTSDINEQTFESK
ncbi:MAG: aminoacetone oxidase family FAD-binding enzyme, partial [Campylobacteraceae bacterium]